MGYFVFFYPAHASSFDSDTTIGTLGLGISRHREGQGIRREGVERLWSSCYSARAEDMFLLCPPLLSGLYFPEDRLDCAHGVHGG